MLPSRLRTGLVLPGVTVALTPARAVTSRLRRRYRERYRERYRFPGLLFGIDALIIALVVTIFGIGVWLSLWQPQDQSGMRLVFSSPPIVTATTIAFEAKISAQDGRVHPDVRLRWVLPAGTEIVSSAPQIDTRNEVLIGDVLPGEEVHARVAVRLFLPPGSARIGFQVRSGEELLSGEEVRPIVGSAVHLKSVFVSDRSLDTRQVLSLHNQGNSSLACLHVQTDGAIPDRQDARIVYGTFFPVQADAVFDNVGPGDERFVSVYQATYARLMCDGVELGRMVLPAFTSAPPSQSVATASLSPSTPGHITTLNVSSSQPLRVLVYHPLLQQAERGRRWFDVASGTTQITLPLDTGKKVVGIPNTTPRWMAWLTRSTSEGVELVRAYDAPITTPMSVQTEARYYAASGGQIGAGPLPPRIGQVTRYWVQWKIPPTETDLSKIEVRASLPTGVSFTGQKALPNGGEFVEEGDQLVWRIPFLAATDEDTTAAFEVSLAPTQDMRDRVPLLLEAAQVTALENRSDVMINVRASSVDTSLPTDEKGKNQGWVK
ncbi:hypothetical protein KBD61_04850 [Patescibacteria group bacterium]|nr:hypothetical protein [Patescibacteria group bacterium]MBP9710319.1 hypothetical protein [Patescibacteria group bacterium]